MPDNTEPLVGWLGSHDLLRGPHLFVDYWASVLDLEGVVPERLEREGLIDNSLFRIGLDRPDLAIPRLRNYLFLFVVGPLLLPFRFFRRLGRYRIKYRREGAEEVLPALERFRLDVEPTGPGRVQVSKAGVVLAEDVMDPFLVSGYSSLFLAAYKMPIASLIAIAAVAIIAPLAHQLPLIATIPVDWAVALFPVVVLILLALFRDWFTAIMGALPVPVARLLIGVARPSGGDEWLTFFAALAAIFVIYVLVDWFFMPRPVPPVLFLYAADGPGQAYERPGDAPYWLEGDRYWVWRYLILSPAEINKFWEKDWERVELWIRADGPDMGALEWIVTDSHWRELWIPYARLGHPTHLARDRTLMAETVAAGRPGFWLVEVDAHPIFHAPFIRASSFLCEDEGVPTRSVWHVLRSMWKQPRDRQVAAHERELYRLRVHEGLDLLEDVPEVVERWAARQMLSQPWRYWRYPLGAATRRESRLYEKQLEREVPPAADPALQIKETSVDLP
ncbi:MAG: hypothetical protein P8Y10_15885 [Gemmatimonadales bacterium]|jgi:hypothetical protein